jgi:hypothetical protein
MTDHHDRDNQAIDAFADALDAITLGLPVPGPASDPLVAFADSLAQAGQPIPTDDAVPNHLLPSRTRRQIWSALMAERGVRPGSTKRPATPGAAGSALALNPWSPRQLTERPRGRRPSGSVARYLPAVQPSSTFLMVVLALVMIGVSFAWIAPERGFAPGASATESAASPEASPAATGDCSVRAGAVPENPSPPAAYVPVGPVDPAVLQPSVTAILTFYSCTSDESVESGQLESFLRSISTPRFNWWITGQGGTDTDEERADSDARVAELTRSWFHPLEPSTESARNPVDDPDPYAVNVLTGSAQTLSDGRIGVLVSFTSPEMSSVPDASWVKVENEGRLPNIMFAALAPTLSGVAIDEFTVLCAGQRCVDTFAPDRSLATPAYQPDIVDAPCVKQYNEWTYHPEGPRNYDRVGSVSPFYLNEVDHFFRGYSGCSDDDDDAKSTFRTIGYSDVANAETTRIASELNQTLTQSLASQQDLRRYTWYLEEGSVRVLNVFAGTASTFGDGRVGVLTTLTDESVSPYPDDSWQAYGSVAGVTTPVVQIVFLSFTGNFLVDEVVTLCAGASCIDLYGADAVSQLATPTAATLVTTDGDQWQRPVTADECVVESRPRDEMTALISTPATIPDRAYLPAVTVDSSTELNVIAAARAWHACANYGLPSQRMALESPAYIWEQSGRTRHDDPARFEARQAATRSFSETLLDPDWTTYFIETAGVDDLAFSGQRSIVQPGHAWRLPDGRVGVVVSQLVPPGTHEERADWPEHSVEFQIFTLGNDRWLLDETLWLCPGGCEVAPGVVSASPVADLPAATCMTAEVHNEPISAPWMTDDLLRNLPWIEVDIGSGDLTLLGLLWYGDRPLEPNGGFPADGMSAKLMWYSSEQIRDLRILAHPVDDATNEPVQVMTNAANSAANGPSMMWPSSMALPGVGCWEITLTATVAETGEPVTGTLIMEVVAPPASTPES